ncbi:uncharacterized protein LY79DRAFT_118512 [Colletotrichum navitas]|uniref:Uncharacterized protein n=1 Tax=Colletotrichum navitas TaxID=681940 RepID=A0AAD8Q352_9PEZI|nr:uncharacterized protein LY79DRAFT_118512 [Colletotrichum navitas]KAK1595080.1 hypothetical protein LY79DRAFT_118512 [Colletotrichum navitas]
MRKYRASEMLPSLLTCHNGLSSGRDNGTARLSLLSHVPVAAVVRCASSRQHDLSKAHPRLQCRGGGGGGGGGTAGRVEIAPGHARCRCSLPLLCILRRAECLGLRSPASAPPPTVFCDVMPGVAAAFILLDIPTGAMPGRQASRPFFFFFSKVRSSPSRSMPRRLSRTDEHWVCMLYADSRG